MVGFGFSWWCARACARGRGASLVTFEISVRTSVHVADASTDPFPAHPQETSVRFPNLHSLARASNNEKIIAALPWIPPAAVQRSYTPLTFPFIWLFVAARTPKVRGPKKNRGGNNTAIAAQRIAAQQGMRFKSRGRGRRQHGKSASYPSVRLGWAFVFANSSRAGAPFSGNDLALLRQLFAWSRFLWETESHYIFFCFVVLDQQRGSRHLELQGSNR
jgi:hypothetical protein